MQNGTRAASGGSVSAEGGSRLNEYEIMKPIGKGKFAIVYRAERVSDRETVALKKILIDTMDEKARHKCLKEVRLLESLDHPNIIKYLDSFIDGNELVIVFEWAAAGDLKRQVRKAQERRMLFDEGVVWKYFSQICAAIRHMHERRIMHRDLKPANIFLTLEGQVKVGDLGLGRAMSENTLEAHSKVGTPLYMSPEVLRGDGYDWKSDIWSLGCLLYELAMLRSPFKSEGLNLYSLFQKISKGDYAPLPEHYSEQLKDLAYRMISTDAADRPGIDEVCAVAAAMKERSANGVMDDSQPEAAALLRRASSGGEVAVGSGGGGGDVNGDGGGGGEEVFAFDQRGRAGSAADQDDAVTVAVERTGASRRQRPEAALPSGRPDQRPEQEAPAGGRANGHGHGNGNGHAGYYPSSNGDHAGQNARRSNGGGDDGEGGRTSGDEHGGGGRRRISAEDGGDAPQDGNQRGQRRPLVNGAAAAGGANTEGGGDAYSGQREPTGATLPPSGLACLLMEQTHDRLCILAYNDNLRSLGRPPLGRLHFAMEGGGARLSRRQQFVDFLALVDWGIPRLGGRGSNLTAAANQAAPHLVATGALNACSAAGWQDLAAPALTPAAAARTAAMTPLQLTPGFGEPMLRLLNWLTSELIMRCEAAPLQYEPGSYGDGADGGLVDVSDDDLEVFEEPMDDGEAAGEAMVLATSLDEGAIAADALDASMTMLAPVADAEQWRQELERVRPRLRVEATPTDWGSRLRALQQGAAVLSSLGLHGLSRSGTPSGIGGDGGGRESRDGRGGFAIVAAVPVGPARPPSTGAAAGAAAGGARAATEDVMAAVAAAGRTAAEQRATVAQGEKWAGGLAEMAALAAEHGAAAAAGAVAAVRRDALHTAVEDKAERLQTLSEDLEEAEKRLADKGESLSDATRLHRLRRAQQNLRAEIGAMDVRAGLVSAELWGLQRTATEHKRISSAKGRRGHGGGPGGGSLSVETAADDDFGFAADV